MLLCNTPCRASGTKIIGGDSINPVIPLHTKAGKANFQKSRVEKVLKEGSLREVRNSMKQDQNRKYAVFLITLSSLLFAVMQLAVKLSSGNIGTMQQVFFRNIISMAVAYILIKKKHLPLFGERKYQPALFARSLAGFLGVVMLFYASAGARQADVSVLSRTSPVWVTLFAALFLKEKISKIQLPVIVLCLAGTLVSMQPSFDSSFLPMLLAALTAVVSGLAYTLVAYCKGKVSPLTVIFHFSLFSTIVSGFLMIPTYVIPTVSDLIMLALVGICGSFGQVALTYAYQLAPASEVSIYAYSGIIFSALLGFCFLGESISVSTLLSAVMIVGSAVWYYRYNRRHGVSTKTEQVYAHE
jgi:drug/metabolite transporter (DMT)-like permease